ncbi:MAG TPA: DNA primase [Candidatus Limnocylindrales bacterium]|nr:DNA primase [Candidatus Limnocylindrales bacterium]
MISQEKIAEIRNRASIVEVISDYVTLKKSGRNHMGLCPFHGEKTPSFTVNEEKGIFHCFGCHAGGGVFQFLMQYDHVSFPEAVEQLAKRYGIVIERTEGRNFQRDLGQRENLYRINECAAANYQRILLDHPQGRVALEYLRRRGIDDATARRFMLGFAPSGGSGLVGLLRKESLALVDAIKLGLVTQRDPQQYYEKFFSRVMFPITNAAGKIVGFGGRVIDQGMPKYLNSSETPLFHKGSTVYGLHEAKESIRQTDRVVLVEGYLDVIALAQHGIGCAVATLGTALTVEHVRALSRYTKNIIALFDGDDAGLKAAARSFEIFIEAGLLGRAALLPKGEDPDTFVRKHGKEAAENLLAQAVPLADYYFSWLQKRYGSTLEGKSQTASEIGRLLTKVNNPFEVDLLIRRAADLGVREELLRRPLAQAVNPRPLSTSRPIAAALAPDDSRDDIAQRSLVGLLLRVPTLLDKLARDARVRLYFSDKWRPVVDAITLEWQETGNIDIGAISQKLPESLVSEVAALVLEAENRSDAECANMATDCLTHLQRKYLKSQERDLRIAIRAAEEKRDDVAKRERILEWQDLLQEKRQLERRRLELKPSPR